MSKYNNIKVKSDGYTFDSKFEAQRYRELKLLARSGSISDLKLQPKYILTHPNNIKTSKNKSGKMKVRSITYISDFEYIKDGKIIVEDVKGFETAIYKLKRTMFLGGMTDGYFCEEFHEVKRSGTVIYKV